MNVAQLSFTAVAFGWEDCGQTSRRIDELGVKKQGRPSQNDDHFLIMMPRGNIYWRSTVSWVHL